MAELRKILLASLDVLPGASGASIRLTEILRGLTPVFQVDVLTPKTEAHAHIERYYGARLMRVPMLRADLPSRAQTFERAVRRQIESEEYDLVHVTDPFGGYPVCQRRGQASHRVVYDAHTLASLTYPLTKPELESELRFMTRLRRIERYCLLNADLVLSTSHAFQARLVQLGVPEERIRVVPPPVELARFRETPFPPDGQLRLVYVGGCTPGEQIETVLRGMRLLLDLGVAAKLSIAGELDPAAQRLVRSLEDELRLGDAVERLGPVSHELIHELLERAHVCLAPFSAPHKLGAVGLGALKFVEYLAAGRPVLAADTPLHRELAGAPPAAVFFRAGDSGNLAGQLRQLAGDPALRAQLADRARDRARNAFDAALARKAVLRAYYDLLDPSVVVTPDAYAAPERVRAADGEAPTSPQPTDGVFPAPEPATGSSAEQTTAIVELSLPPSEEPTPVTPEPTTAVVALPLTDEVAPSPIPLVAAVAPELSSPPEATPGPPEPVAEALPLPLTAEVTPSPIPLLLADAAEPPPIPLTLEPISEAEPLPLTAEISPPPIPLVVSEAPEPIPLTLEPIAEAEPLPLPLTAEISPPPIPLVVSEAAEPQPEPTPLTLEPISETEPLLPTAEVSPAPIPVVLADAPQPEPTPPILEPIAAAEALLTVPPPAPEAPPLRVPLVDFRETEPHPAELDFLREPTPFELVAALEPPLPPERAPAELLAQAGPAGLELVEELEPLPAEPGAPEAAPASLAAVPEPPPSAAAIAPLPQFDDDWFSAYLPPDPGPG